MPPLRVGYAAPNLWPNGVFQWICALAENTDPDEIEWVGGLIVGPRDIDPVCARRLARQMPLHAVQATRWEGWYNVSDTCQFHAQTQQAYAALAQADVILAWELDAGLLPFFQAGIPVVLISHTQHWAPRLPETRQAIHAVAVSEAAAAPFLAIGLQPEIIHAGCSLDRCMPRQSLRPSWRAGPKHRVIACLDRHDASKDPRIFPQVLKALDYQHLGVWYGGDGTGQPARWLVQECAELPRLQFFPHTEAVGDVYGSCDLVFSATRSEAFGQVLVEAITMGLPVVCPENTGVIPELERQTGLTLAYKYAPQGSAEDIARFIVAVFEHQSDNRARAAATLRRHVSGHALAGRWTRYLTRFRRQPAPASRARTIVPRWRAASRPVRALLVCANAYDVPIQMAARPDVVWTQVFVDDTQTLPQQDPEWPPTICGHDGPAWCHTSGQPVRNFESAARLVDVVVLRPDADATLAQHTTAPIVTSAQDICIPVSPLSSDVRPLRAFFLCAGMNFGGTEYWFEQLFERAQAHNFQWVGYGCTATPPRNAVMAARLEQAGCPVWDCHAVPECAAQAIQQAQPDVIVICAVETVGRFIPAGYTGPIVSVQHNSLFDPWARQWVRAADPMVSHSAAVSYLAAGAYPEERQDSVAVLYPGVAPLPHALESSAQLRARMRAQLHIEPDEIVVCFAGRTDGNKRPELAAQAVALLPRQYQFLFVGDAAEWPHGNFSDYLLRTLDARAHVHPYTEHLSDYLAAVDVLVLCSQHESFGLVLMQALQQDCAVVAPSRSILGELQTDPAWAHGRWALCDSAVPAELAQAIVGAYKKPVCALPIQERFGAEVSATDFFSFLRTIATEDKPLRRTMLRELTYAPARIKPLQSGVLGCDAVLPLRTDPAANAQAVRELLAQDAALCFVHAVGPGARWAQLPADVREHLRVVYTDAPEASWVAAALACRQRLRTEFVLTAGAEWRSHPQRAQHACAEMWANGLEAVLESPSGALNAIRRQALIDLWLCRQSLNTLTATRRTGTYATAHMRPRAGIHQRTPDLDVFPALPGRQTCAAILPFRGQLAWVREAIAGLQAQENVNLTIYLVDDATGTPEADALLREMQEQPNIQCYRSRQNIGQFMAANAIAARTSDPVYLIQDGDDISLPHRAWLTCAALQESAAEIFTGAVMAFGGSLRILSSTYPYPGAWYYAINPACGFTRGAFERLGGYMDFRSLAANKASLDTDFFQRCVGAGLRCHITESILVQYRQHAQSCTSDSTLGIGTRLRQTMEREITQRTQFGLQGQLRGDLRACADLIEPFV